MLNKLTLTQKITIAFALVAMLLIVNSMLAVFSASNYHHAIKKEIHKMQPSQDLENIIKFSDSISKQVRLMMITCALTSIIMIIPISFLIIKQVRSFKDDLKESSK